MAQLRHYFIFAFLCVATFLIAKPKTTMPPVHVYLTNTDMECGKSTPTSVRVRDFKNVTNFQFTMHFVNSRVKGDSVVKVNPKFPETAVTAATMPNGDISFSWSGSPVTLNDDEILFTAYLTPYFYGLTGNGYTPITIENMPTPIQAYTSASIINTYPVTTANAQIKIIDKTVPTALCPNSQFYKGLDSVLVANITGVAIDDCGGASITNFKMTGANNITGTNDANGKYYKLGVTKVTYTATDYAGNTAQCPFKIILVKDSDDTLTVFANSQLTKCENSSFMDFAVFVGNADGKNLNKLNFSLSWNKANFKFLSTLQLSSLLPGGTFNTTMSADGRLGFTWSGSNLNLTDNQRLFTIRLQPMGLASQTAVMVSGLPVPVAVSSPTLSSYPVRTEPGELFIVDTKAPDLLCRPDTLIYATTPTGATAVPGSAIKPKLTENCILDKYNYKMTGATTKILSPFDENSSYDFNEGITNVAYDALDYGGGTASCNSNVQVNRLKFTVSKDSIPCSTPSTNITVKVKDFEKLKDSKYTITWNPTMMSLSQAAITYIDNTIKNNMTISGNVSSGSLTFTWALPSGSHTIADDAVLMNLPFNLIGKVNSPITFAFNSGRVINTNTNITAQVINGSVKNYDTQKPSITNCPSDKIEIVTQAGVCTKKVSWNVPTVTDDCDALVNNNTKIYKQLGTSFPANTPTFSGDDFGLGQNIITYVASDVFGNTSTCSFTINVSENVPPQIVACTPNVSASTEPGKNGASLSWGSPSVNESCGVQSEVFSKAKGSYFIVGKQTINYTVTDKSGNTATCSFTVTVTDNENPVFINPSFPTNTTIVSQTDTCGAKVTWNLPTASDNHTASNLIKITSNFPSGAFFPVGKTTVIYTAVDSSGNAVIRNFEVTILDGQAPKFVSCPAEITVSATPTLCNAIITPPVLKTKDNCKGLIDVFPTGVPANNAFPIGSTPLLYTDPNDPTVKCAVNLVVKVTQKPVFTALNDISVSTNPNDCKGTLPATAKPTATDACGNVNSVTITQSPSGNQFSPGVNIITYTATDTYSNSTTATVKFIVTDINPPTLSACPKNITTNAEPGKNGAVITWIPPTAKAFCNGTITLVPTQQPNTLFPIGTTPVTYTATDNNGNSLTCSFTIKVIDNQPPVINCPPTKQLSATAAPGTCSQVVPLPTFTDNSGKIPTIVSSNGVNPNDIYPVGKTVVTFTVSDEAGNTASCSFDIIIKITDKPTLTAVTDITLSTDLNDCKGTLPATAKPTATDACGNNTVTVAQNPNLTTFPIGTTTVTFTATDTYGNTSTTSMKVTIKDINPPTLGACPKDITTNAELGKNGAIVNWIPPTAKAFCNGVITLVPTQNPNTLFPIGTTPVTYTATDNNGNSLTCSFTVKVIDNQPPVINCPPTKQLSATAAAGTCTQVVPLPTFTDNSGKIPTIVSSNGVNPNDIYPVGKTVVTFTVSDEAGNTASCSFDIIVKITDKPSLTSVTDITLSTDLNDCKGTLPATAKPTATDACGNNTVTVTQNPNLTTFPIGTTTVTFTATDTYGNTSTTSMKVTVKDNNPPTMTNCPADITAKADTGKKGAIITWTPPTAKAFCAGTVNVVSTNQPNAFYNIGNTVVTYTATDQSGNTLTCSFNINVSDGEPPVINCPPTKLVTLNADPVLCGQAFALPTFSDNSGIPPTIISSTGIPTGNLYPIGKTTVSFTIADDGGNTTSCTFDVIVKDLIKPTFTNVKDITVNTDPTTCTAKLSPSDLPQAADGCGNTTLDIKSNIDTDKMPQGVSTVILVATDPDGNKENATFKVTVVDNVPPVLAACPNKIILPTDPGKDFATANWTPPTASDNCSVTVKSSNKPGDTFAIGTKIVTYTATDGSGNTTTCTFEVEVTDQEKPTIACKDITVNNKAGECGGTLVSLPQITDNVKVINTVYNPTLPANNYFNVGEQTFNISATDAAGNLSNCTLKVIIADNETPKAATCPKDITASAAVGECTVTVPALPAPTFTDNCDVANLVITSNRDGLANPLEFPAGATTKVIFTAKDKGGNTTTCEYNVIVSGNSKPTLTCPNAISLKISPNKCDTVINWLPANAVVGCSPLVGTPTSNINSGSIFKSGTTTVTYTVKDQAGLEGTCTFDVIVKESTKPTFASNFPKDVELPASSTDCSAIYTWIAPTAIDNCTIAADLIIKQIAGPKAGDKLNIGVQTVTYEVTDKSGNKFEQSFNITVKDKTAPSFVLCPKDVKVDMFGKVISDPDNFIASVSKSTDCKTVDLTFQPIDATDKCSIPVTITNSGAATFNVDQPTEYKYRATDAAGNAAECKFNVTVEGIVLPNLTSTTTVSGGPAGSNMSCPGADIQLKADLIAGVTYTWTGPNGFTSTEQNPLIKNATSKDKGNYTLKVTKGTCVSAESKPLKVDIMTMPKAKEDKYEMYTGDVLSDTVFPNDSLIAGEATLVKVTDNTKSGQLKMRNDGFFDYTPQPKFYGNDDFKYDVCYETCPTSCSGPTLARIVIKVKEVKIPNVISPNDDGVNDMMIIDYPFNGTEKAELNIYNEWGHLVYGVKPYTNAQAWQGTFKDQPVPDGTYYYVFTIDEGAEIIKGFITVLR